MIGIMLYYWRDTRYHIKAGKQMLRDLGLIKSPWERLLDLWDRMTGRADNKKRAARWCRH